LILIGQAAERKTLTYEMLSEMLGFERGAGVLSQTLGHIMFWCTQNGLPALTTLVVGKGSGTPGDGLTSVEDREAAREQVFEFDWYDLVPPSVEDLDAAYRKGTGPGGQS
jgi:hypothetical protein